MTACRSCQKPILWAKTPSGRAMPLDADPVASGNVTLRSDGVAIVGTPGSGTYVSHFSTCRAAAQHRRPR